VPVAGNPWRFPGSAFYADPAWSRIDPLWEDLVSISPKRFARPVALAAAAAAVVLLPLGTAATASAQTLPATAPAQVSPLTAGDGTVAGAIQWMQNHKGATGWEEYCEKAVENAYGTTGVWPSAIAHWNGAIAAGKAHKGGTNPPKGAFVYWNTSQYGHVGIADGSGGFYSSSINGAIGHSTTLSYFPNYLGWSDAQVPA
jgi:hypothetical protein